MPIPNRYSILVSLLLLFLLPQGVAARQEGFSVVVSDSLSGDPIPYAMVSLNQNGRNYSGITNNAGEALFSGMNSTPYDMTVSHIGYYSYHAKITFGDIAAKYRVRLLQSAMEIEGVVVTASEVRDEMTSTSRIGRKAMEHLQPSSFSDLLQLLPGGRSSDPDFSQPNSIRLREAPGVTTDYNTSSLGTSFMVDGVPINSDANLQYIAGEQSSALQGMNSMNKGVDMRSIPTDDIEVVEIVRGIASVEYGDLTSGLVKIERKKGGNKLDARFKADMSSKLYYVAKGFEDTKKGLTVNANLDFLDSKNDPRDRLLNYRRLTGSVRVSKTGEGTDYRKIWNTSLDYTGSFDNVKTDPDLHKGKEDSYKSTYNALRWIGSLSMDRKTEGAFRGFDLTASVSARRDEIKRVFFKEIIRVGGLPNTMVEGESDATIFFGNYTARHKVDGRPLDIYVKGSFDFRFPVAGLGNRIKTGADWSFSKNYGKGQVFDMDRPINMNTSSRPRAYDIIPARHEISFFAEDSTGVRMGDYSLIVAGGVRVSSLMNQGSGFDMQGKIYFDPRVNMKFGFPQIMLFGKPAKAELTAGIGWHTKFPTMNQLFPSPIYHDIVGLNYTPDGLPEYWKIRYTTHIIDPTNYSLHPARNLKWEVRGDISVDGNRLSVTWFNEDMKSGFRNSSTYQTFVYRNFKDMNDFGSVTPPIDLEELDFRMDTLITPIGRTTNGGRTLKQGVEFTFSSKRIESIRTRVTITGAWFKTTYEDSQLVYATSSSSIGGVPNPYVGVYRDGSSTERQWVNTNFMFDTDVPRLGLGFSMLFECMWHSSYRNTGGETYPVSYMDKQGIEHRYTEESRNDPYLRALARSIRDMYEKTPFEMNVNVKVTKKIFKDKMALALYVNRLLVFTPKKISSDYIKIHSDSPYFGMELNMRL